MRSGRPRRVSSSREREGRLERDWCDSSSAGAPRGPIPADRLRAASARIGGAAAPAKDRVAHRAGSVSQANGREEAIAARSNYSRAARVRARRAVSSASSSASPGDLSVANGAVFIPDRILQQHIDDFSLPSAAVARRASVIPMESSKCFSGRVLDRSRPDLPAGQASSKLSLIHEGPPLRRAPRGEERPWSF